MPEFCLQCGTPIATPSTPAEYKQVTVLFADVVRSMDIAAAVGAERLREIMAELLDRSTAVVKRYGGTVNQFTGDGIMAVFGAPVTLEDHAFRAGLAALEIQKATETVAFEVKRRDGIEFRLRIGLNSGQVIAGEIGSSPKGLHSDRRASGNGSTHGIGCPARWSDAQRIDRPTGGKRGRPRRARTRSDKGCRRNPCVPGSCWPSANTRPLRRTESALVGRSWELNTITAILDEAIGGAGCVVTVVGPPGIGKSRLIRESAAIAAGRGVRSDHHILRVAHPRHPVPCGSPVVARRYRDQRTRLRDRPVPRPRPVPRRGSRRHRPARRPGGHSGRRGPTARCRPRCAAATVDRADQLRIARPPRPHGVRHRGCALDRRSQ